MPIDYEVSSDPLDLIINGVPYTCSSVNHKNDIINVIRNMNSDEQICVDGFTYNPNLPPYLWAIETLIDGISIGKPGVAAVKIFAQENLSSINDAFQEQIKDGLRWCTGAQRS